MSPVHTTRTRTANDPRKSPALSRSNIAATRQGLFAGLILSLFLARFFYVAESADQGETLWIAGGWLALLAMWAFSSTWWPATWLRPGWSGLGVGLLAGGHIVAALIVIATTGDQRSAINLAWEWVGLTAASILLHQFGGYAAFRRTLPVGLIAAGTASAGLGLYQHYIEFPQTAAQFGPLFDRLKQADPVEAASIRRIMARDNIPVDGPSATLFEKRLRDSREPLGFFALANTFSGFLGVCLILSTAALVSQWRDSCPARWQRLMFWAGIVLLLSWTLLLTKSRTAWIGTLAGLVTFGLMSRNAKWTGRGIRAIAFVVASGIVLTVAVAQFGGLDPQVISEAPKSLVYRLQYWQATSRMIADHLWFGVGPGQFRSHYLYYKLPEASEEIADPHNLFLETLATGGILALAGLLILCGVLFKTMGSYNPLPNALQPQSGGDSNSQRSLETRTLARVVISAATMGWVWQLLNGSDDRLLIVLPVAASLFWWLLTTPVFEETNPDTIQSIWPTAALALMIHLCGAGGIGMPVVTLLLIALIEYGSFSANQKRSLSASPAETAATRHPLYEWGLAGLSAGLLVMLYVTGVRPVSFVQDEIFLGDQLVQKGDLDGADAHYRAAENFDSWSSEATRRRSELWYRKGISRGNQSNESFQTAVGLLERARLRNPSNFRDDLRSGEWWVEHWRVSQNSGDAEQAVAALQRAWLRYPTNANLMADLARFYQQTGATGKAWAMAQRALQQDQINRNWGHVDRYLSTQQRQELEAIMELPISEKERE